jgi:hypothetical protein
VRLACLESGLFQEPPSTGFIKSQPFHDLPQIELMHTGHIIQQNYNME